MFEEFEPQTGVTLCILDGRIKREPNIEQYTDMQRLQQAEGTVHMTLKEYKNLINDGGTKESFYITSDSAVFQKLANPVDEEAMKRANMPDYQAIYKSKNLPINKKESLQIKSKYRYDQFKKMKYLSYFQIQQLKMKEEMQKKAEQAALFGGVDKEGNV